MARTNSVGFFPAPGTDYAYGQEPELKRRLSRLARALKLHLIGISGHRTPQHSVEVGGFANDPHTRGQASDTPGIEGVPESTLRRYGLTRPFPGASEADHIQLLGGARGTHAPQRQQRTYSLADYWVQGGGRRGLAPIMGAIGMAESGGRIDAVGGPNSDGSYDYGWLQINSSHGYDPTKLTSDPVYTARAGAAIERSQGLSAWTTYKSGAYRAFMGGGQDYAPKFGRTRPGGDTTEPDPSSTIFADYIAESDSGGSTENVGLLDPLYGPLNPFGPGGAPKPFNPVKPFQDTAKAINSVSDFLKWIAWIFHPRNVLRAVEFLSGLTFILLGIHTAIQVHKGDEETSIKRGAKEAVAATPVGRGMRVAKGARAGRQATRAASRRKEFEGAYKRGKKGETRRQSERATDKKYGKDAPF